MRRRLEAEGPLAVAIGHRLAGRRDVLPVTWCRLLASGRTDDPAQAEIDALRPVFDRLPEGWFLDPEPESVRLTTQVHRGRTVEGRSLRLEWLRPSGRAALERADDAIDAVVSILRETVPRGFPSTGRSPFDPRALVAAAHAELLASSDPARRAGALQAMAVLPDTVPTPQPDLPRGVLAWIDGGIDLDSWWADGPSRQVARSVSVSLAHAWLRQALHGPTMPAPIGWSDAVVTASDTAWLIAGATDEAEPACQEALEAALIALHADRPEASADAFLDLFEPHPATAALRRRLPMASSFDSLPDPQGHGRLIEPLMLYWRCAIDAGLRPRATADGLLSGLARLDLLVAEILPDDDAIDAAVGRLVTDAERRSWGTAFDLGAWRRELEPISQALVHLPAKLDHTLSRLADGDWTIRLETPPAPRRTVGLGARVPTILVGLLLVLCGVELSSPWLTAAAWLAAGFLLGQAGRQVDAP